MPRSRFHAALIAPVFIVALFILAMAASWLGYDDLVSDDLAGHIAIVLRMSEAGSPWFYDRSWFGGYPVSEFYGFAAHWIASLPVSLSSSPWSTASGTVRAIMVGSFVLIPIMAWAWLRGLIRAESSLALGVMICGVVLVSSRFVVFESAGIAAGIRHTFDAGLFAQAPGWLFMLCFLASVSHGKGAFGSLLTQALIYNLLFATHPLPAVSALLISAAVTLTHDGPRRLIPHLAVMLSTTAWQWLPSLSLGTSFGAGQPFWSEIALLALVADGWLDLLNGLPWSIPGLIAETLCLIALMSSCVLALVRPSPASRATVMLLLLASLLSGSAPAEATTIGFYYVRIMVCLVFAAQWLSFVAVGNAAADWSTPLGRSRPFRSALVGAATILSVAGLVEVYRDLPWPSSGTTGILEEEYRLLDRLSQLPEGSRLAVERGTSVDAYHPGKFLESAAWSQANMEVLNGLLLASSKPFRYHSTALNHLSVSTFSLAPVRLPLGTVPPTIAVEVLARSSTTHIITSSAAAAQTLNATSGVTQIDQSGPYTIWAITAAQPVMRQLSVPVIGYLDLTGELPFFYLDAFVEFDARLSGRLRLIDLHGAPPEQVQVDAVVINTTDPGERVQWVSGRFGKAERPLLRIGFNPSKQQRHERRADQNRRTLEESASYFQRIGLLRHLLALQKSGPPPALTPTLTWLDNDQTLAIDGLRPGAWYELSYSHFPAWMADGGILFRGSGGRMMLFADNDKALATYDRWAMRPVRIGLLITLLSTLVMLGAYLRTRTFFKPSP